MKNIKLISLSLLTAMLLTSCSMSDNGTVSPSPDAVYDNNDVSEDVRDVGDDASNAVKDVGDATGDVVEGVGDAAGDVLDGVDTQESDNSVY